MTEKNSTVGKEKVLEEIICNASGLSLESQNLLLILAKGMAYTRDCLIKQNANK